MIKVLCRLISALFPGNISEAKKKECKMLDKIMIYYKIFIISFIQIKQTK